MDSMHCLYASKPCENPRSLKDNGELHRLCTFHRAKANDAQRRWHSRKRGGPPTVIETEITQVSDRTKRRRRQRAQGSMTDGTSPPSRRQQQMMQHVKAIVPASPPSVDTMLVPHLDADDLALLEELMSDFEDLPGLPADPYTGIIGDFMWPLTEIIVFDASFV